MNSFAMTTVSHKFIPYHAIVQCLRTLNLQGQMGKLLKDKWVQFSGLLHSIPLQCSGPASCTLSHDNVQELASSCILSHYNVQEPASCTLSHYNVQGPASSCILSHYNVQGLASCILSHYNIQGLSNRQNKGLYQDLPGEGG